MAWVTTGIGIWTLTYAAIERYYTWKTNMQFLQKLAFLEEIQETEDPEKRTYQIIQEII